MDQAHTIADPTKIVPLQNGAFANSQLVFDTEIKVYQTLHENGPQALIELYQHLSTRDKQISESAKTVLIKYGLLDHNAAPYANQKNIILSMIRKRNNKMAIGTAVNYH